MTDGRAKVRSAPTENDDVVRKQELDTKLDKALIPSQYLPSYVDDVLEYDSKNDFPKPGETGKIYVDKSTNLTYRWSGSTYIQVGGGDLNIENGTGLDTLVLKYSGEVDDLHYPSSTTGESDVCLGEANMSSGKRNILGGKLNENTGSNNLIAGLQNKVSGNHSIVGGASNDVTGYADATVGTYNNVKGHSCLGGGTANDISGDESIFNGHNNKLTGSQSFMLGDQNTSEFNQTFIAGVKSVASRERQYIFGSWAKEDVNAVFIVSDRQGPDDTELTDNNFMVMSDGRGKIYGEPIESNDILRLKEFSVLTQKQVDLLF